MNRFLKGVIASCAGVLLLVALLIPNGIASGFAQHKTSRQSKVDELFNRNCARCHGADGRGDTPSGHLFKSPDFTDAEWRQKNATLTGTRSLRLLVARGKGAMPAFGKKLTKSEINQLVDRVRRFKK